MKIDQDNFIKEIKLKNPKALDFVVDTYSNLIIKVVHSVLNSGFHAQSVEECVSDVFWATWTNFESFDEEKGDFKYWITAIAKYKAIDYKRKLYKQSTDESKEEYNFADDVNTESLIILNDVIADDSKLIIGYTIKSDEKLNNLGMLGLGRFLSINGKVDGSGGGASGYNTDDYTYVGSEELNTDLLGESEKVNVDLKITELLGTEIKGKWDFAFSVSKDQLVSASTVFTPNYKVDFPDSNVTVDKVVFSPIDTSIFYSGNFKVENTELLSGFDYNNWIVYDDKGVELKWKGGGEKDYKNNFNGGMSFTNFKDIPKYITILPCKVIPSGGRGETIDAKTGKVTPLTIETMDPGENSKVINIKDQIAYPIELSQGKMGKIIIKEIKKENNNIILKFTAEGKAPYTQASGLCIKDINGELLYFKDLNFKIDEANPNEFTMNITSLNPDEEFTLCTSNYNNLEIREDLKFKIELNN